jgi:tetratricopeptide (TPR) repeat protein
MHRRRLYKPGFCLAFLLGSPSWLHAQPALAAAPPAASGMAPSNAAAGASKGTAAARGAEPAQAKLDAPSALERARSLYEAGRFDRCRQAYAEVLPAGAPEPEAVDVETVEQSRLYYAACLLAIGEREQAEEQVREALTRNPLMASPDPVVFPSQVRDLFFTVKSDFLEEIRIAQEKKLRQAERMTQAREERARRERERVHMLEQLAGQESLVHKNRRWLAAIPFGVGQFQNGDDGLGAFFLTSETLFLATVVTGISLQLQTTVDAGGRSGKVGDGVVDQQAVNDALGLYYNLQLVGLGGLTASALIGIIEAQWNFVPEIALGARPRALPSQVRAGSKASIKASVTPTADGGALLGIRGRF